MIKGLQIKWFINQQLILINLNKQSQYTMQHSVHAKKGLGLSTILRSEKLEPTAATLKSQMVSYRDTVSFADRSSIGGTKSSQITEASRENPQRRWEKMIAHQKDINTSWEHEIEQQRQSLIATSRQIKWISTEFDDSLHRSKENSLNVSRDDNRNSLNRKEQVFEARSPEVSNTKAINQIKFQHQVQVQDLMSRIARLEAENKSLKVENEQALKSLHLSRQSNTQIEMVIMQKERDELRMRLKALESSLIEKNEQFGSMYMQIQKSKTRIQKLEQENLILNLQKQHNLKQIGNYKEEKKEKEKQFEELQGRAKKLEIEKKSLIALLDDEKVRACKIEQNKKMMEMELKNLHKIKQLARVLQNSDEDKTREIKNHIAYEVQILDIQNQMAVNVEHHKLDVKQAQNQQNNMNKQLELLNREIASKVKQILSQKFKLEAELGLAREQTEKIRSEMFTGYQQIIYTLKDEILQLKQENINLTNNNESKITIIKQSNDIAMLTKKNQDLIGRVKNFEELVEKMNQNQKHNRKCSERTSETEIKSLGNFQKGSNNLENVIKAYEERSVSLHKRIHEKQIQEEVLKKKVEELSSECEQLRSQLHLSSRKERSQSENTKSQLQQIKLQLKFETQSLSRKIQALQGNIKRKSKQIKEKDEFITKYLIPKVKDKSEVTQILDEVNKFFNEQ